MRRIDRAAQAIRRAEREAIAKAAEEWAAEAMEKHGFPATDGWRLVAGWFNTFAGYVRHERFRRYPSADPKKGGG